jgi:CRP-like cAMP-binding protein
MLQRADRFFNVIGLGIEESEVEIRLKVLGKGAVFASVPTADLRVLATMFETRAYAGGDRICTAGEPAVCIYAVQSGEVKVRLPGPDGDATVAIMRAGDLVGKYGMFLPEGRSATLVARRDTIVLVLDYPRFKRFLMAFPESMLALMSLTVDRLLDLQAELRDAPPGWPVR